MAASSPGVSLPSDASVVGPERGGADAQRCERSGRRRTVGFNVANCMFPELHLNLKLVITVPWGQTAAPRG